MTKSYGMYSMAFLLEKYKKIAICRWAILIYHNHLRNDVSYHHPYTQ